MSIEAERENLLVIHPDVFDTHVRQFGSFPETTLYMDAKCKHLALLKQINTLCSVYEAILVGKTMLVLCPEDTRGVRDVLPGLYLRIGSYDAIHECYQLLYKWNHDFHVPRGKFCSSVRPQESIFEALPRGFFTKLCSAIHIAAMCVINCALYRDASTNICQVGHLMYAATHSITGMQLLRGNDLVLTNIAAFLRPNFPTIRLLSFSRRRFTARALKTQLQQLISAGTARNKQFWKVLLNPEKALAAHACESASETVFAAHVLDAFMRDGPRYLGDPIPGQSVERRY